MTAVDGSFQLDKVPAAERQVLTVEADGFVDGKVVVKVLSDQTVRTSAHLVRAAAVTVIDPASAATVTAAGSNASVVLPADGLVNGSGAAANGMVSMRITPIDSAADPQSMPGQLHDQYQ